jgi:dolichol-phosphate mannosyltransferase
VLNEGEITTASPSPGQEGDGDPLLSVVIPVLDEEDNLPELHRALTEVLARLGTYEIVFVDDGSEDSSVEIIGELARHDSTVKLIRLSRNFGHQAALSAGLDHAAGHAVVLMDADLQDPPQLLTELVEQWRAGHEVVYAIRAKRQAPPLKRACYFLFYRLYQRLAEMEVPLDSGSFCLIDRRVAEVIRALPERNRFLPGLRSWVGFRQVGVAYERPDRLAGDVKYTTRRLVRLALDGLFSFSSFPLRLASYLGFFTAALGVAYTLFAVVARLFVGELPAGWTSTIAILLTVSGVQLIMTGVLGEYLARTYDETKGRPLYVVRDAHGVRRQR